MSTANEPRIGARVRPLIALSEGVIDYRVGSLFGIQFGTAGHIILRTDQFEVIPDPLKIDGTVDPRTDPEPQR